MPRVRRFAGLAFVLIFAAGLGYAAWRMAAGPPVCRACGRAVHAEMRTVALLGGKREVFCCPSCARSAAAQAHRRIQFERLSDYLTGRPLDPAGAFTVTGSDVIPCVRTRQIIDREARAMPMEFDRCAPSIIAFADRNSAEQFAAQHGGAVSKFVP